MRRVLPTIVAILILAEIALWAGAYWAMRQTPDACGRIVARTPMPLMMALPFETLWNRARGGAVAVGDEAPDFRLSTLDRRSSVQLGSFRGDRPVVLVF